MWRTLMPLARWRVELPLLGRGPGVVRVFAVKAPGLPEALARALEEAERSCRAASPGAELVRIPGMGHVHFIGYTLRGDGTRVTEPVELEVNLVTATCCTLDRRDREEVA
jgi:hypothetical protein